MIYTITTGFRTDRLYSRTDTIMADNPKAAKELILNIIMKEHPDATDIRQRAQKSHRD